MFVWFLVKFLDFIAKDGISFTVKSKSSILFKTPLKKNNIINYMYIKLFLY